MSEKKGKRIELEEEVVKNETKKVITNEANEKEVEEVKQAKKTKFKKILKRCAIGVGSVFALTLAYGVGYKKGEAQYNRVMEDSEDYSENNDETLLLDEQNSDNN